MKYFIYAVIGLVLIGGLVYSFRERILLAIGNFLIIQDQLEPVDVIHVISGPDHRTAYGIQLYNEGYAKYLFFTGGWCAEIQGVHADRSRQQSLEQGIPASAIGSDSYQVTSTYQEVERLKVWIDQSQIPIRSIIVVSDPHHMRRARWVYKQQFGKDVKVIMAPVPFDQSPYLQRWWGDAASRTMVRDEYIKFVYYIVRYKLSWGPIKEWLASLDTE